MTLSAGREFVSTEVCRLARVSARQLQWWDERGIVSPQQQGRRRVFPASEVIVMMVMAELRRKGVSLQKIHRLARQIRREVEHRLQNLLSGEADLLLATDGAAAWYADQPERVIEILKRSREPVLVVSVRDQAVRLLEFQKSAGKSRRGKQLDLF